jgi:signal transduction histidine kinase
MHTRTHALPSLTKSKLALPFLSLIAAGSFLCRVLLFFLLLFWGDFNLLWFFSLVLSSLSTGCFVQLSVLRSPGMPSMRRWPGTYHSIVFPWFLHHCSELARSLLETVVFRFRRKKKKEKKKKKQAHSRWPRTNDDTVEVEALAAAMAAALQEAVPAAAAAVWRVAAAERTR